MKMLETMNLNIPCSRSETYFTFDAAHSDWQDVFSYSTGLGTLSALPARCVCEWGTWQIMALAGFMQEMVQYRRQELCTVWRTNCVATAVDLASKLHHFMSLPLTTYG